MSDAYAKRLIEVAFPRMQTSIDQLYEKDVRHISRQITEADDSIASFTQRHRDTPRAVE